MSVAISFLSERQIQQFNENGYLTIDNFISDKLCSQLKNEVSNLVNKHDFTNFNHSFGADSNREKHDKYFFESWNKINFFLENQKETDKVNESINGQTPKLNKIGHSLHKELEIYKDISFDSRINAICHQLGFQKPAICQSMYIYKCPKIGTAVFPHQDASFLWTEPECRILGFWIPLEDVTLENGCLWAVPGSHKNGLLNNVRFIHDPSKGDYSTKFTAEYPDISHEKYKPILLKKGGLVLIHGYVLHKSLPNTSPLPRDVYTWHIVDCNDGTRWHKSNWIQPPNGIDDFSKV